MKTLDVIKARRTYYAINDQLPVEDTTVVDFVKKATELVPDAFNMKSARAVVVLGDKHKQLWDVIYDAFGGKVPREKIDSFKAGYGTVLYFTDEATVKALQDQFPAYAGNFPHWAAQAVGMLEFTVWTGLHELGIGASIQHYNPVIDAAVKTLLQLPDEWHLDAQMPFGGIVSEPDAKAAEDINQRVRVIK